jgi:single-strand DNA-binding protein
MLNRVILMGRLVADPELKTTPSGVSVCKFTIAVDRPYSKDKEKVTDFPRITTWRNTAEFVQKYFSKGKMIIVEGRLQNNDYTDSNGVKHYSMEVLAENVSFGESKGSSSNSNQPSINTSNASQSTDNSIQIGDLGDFEEILSDGEIPF